MKRQILKNKQLISSKGNGDCLRACLTSILGIENSRKIPATTGKNWLNNWFRFLGKFGIHLMWDEKKIWREGYWIASVPSLNYKNTLHAVVMKGTKVYFDPSTKKRYRTGKDLLGSNVHHGYWLEIEDISKLHNLFL